MLGVHSGEDSRIESDVAIPKYPAAEAPSLEALVNGIIDHDQLNDWFWGPIYYDDFRLDGAAHSKRQRPSWRLRTFEHVGFDSVKYRAQEWSF